MAAAAPRPPARRNAAPAKAARAKPAMVPPTRSKPAPAKSVTSSKPPEPKKPKRIRGDFAMPEPDFARIAALKDGARRAGLNVKKNELLRLGLQALQSLPPAELHDRIRTLRLPAKTT